MNANTCTAAAEKRDLRQSGLLPGEDAATFRCTRQELYDAYRPRTRTEARCVDAMAHHLWAMERCRAWRTAYHAKLNALVYGDPAGDAASHCETDPHRWHHSA